MTKESNTVQPDVRCMIILKKGTRIKTDGIPFELEHDIVVKGNISNLSLLGKRYKSFGVPSVLCVAQADISETTKPSSESMNCLK